MVDRYTKIILTVIAVSLAVIAIRQSNSPARAAFGDCGATFIQPCHIVIDK
jgi:hypothetical protein